MTPCCKKGCPAMSDVDVCRVHSPEKIIERMRAIILKRFEDFDLNAAPDFVRELCDTILSDLDSTI